MKLLQKNDEVDQYVSVLSEIHHSYVQFKKHYQHLEIKFVKNRMK